MSPCCDLVIWLTIRTARVFGATHANRPVICMQIISFLIAYLLPMVFISVLITDLRPLVIICILVSHILPPVIVTYILITDLLGLYVPCGLGSPCLWTSSLLSTFYGSCGPCPFLILLANGTSG